MKEAEITVCPQCGADNPADAIRCGKCNTPLSTDLTTTGGAAEGWTAGSQSGVSSGVYRATYAVLEPGSVLGNRYEILQLLGEGGMGAVYKVRDREVDRFVALKVIRPELAVHPEILQRFKQELILARQVTHKNVIRIFDLGEADGVKFITMDFIEGKDLKSLLHERGKLPPDETVKIIAQVCRALEAAHAEGVVHRDLKPQNIMVDAQGRVTVMDFGIARSVEMPGITQTGAVIGTPEYMSPEQAKGEHVDARSDLFTTGIIFYELLTGETPFRADTAYAMLLKRTTQRAKPPIELDASIPQQISDVVVKCLETDASQRYQSAREILEDLGLEAQTGTRPRPITVGASTATVAQAPLAALMQRYGKMIAGGVAALVLIFLGVIFRGKIFSAGGKGATGPSISLAILPFHNASGDTSLDWLGPSLADMLTTDVGQSAHLQTVSTDRTHQILRDLQIAPNTSIDPATLRRLGQFSNAEMIVSGQFVKIGEQIRIDATLRDLKRDRTTGLKAEAPNEKELLGAVERLAQAIRENLALSPDILKELQAQSLKPSSKSLLALRYYNEGLEFARQGKNLDAVKKFEAATKEDPDFGLAYSQLALTDSALGYGADAEQFSRKAMGLSESLPAQEKYLIAANHARIVKDYPKAIESYENLLKVSPNNTDFQFALAKLYEDTSAFDKAREHYGKVLEANPKSADALLAMGRVQIKGGDAQGGLDFLNRALSLSVELGNDEEKAMVLQAIGVAYSWVLNKPEEALRNYQQSLEIRRRLGDKRGIADSLKGIAGIETDLGKTDSALKNYNEAMQLLREIGDKGRLGDVLNDLGDFQNGRGRYDDALKLFKESLQIQRDMGNEINQGFALNNIGNTYLFKGDYENARTYFEQALQIREKLKSTGRIADTLHNLAEVSTKTGQYDQALTQYLRALDLRRSAGDKRFAAIESYSMGTVFGYQGRYGAAVNSKEEALKTFRGLQEHSFWMAEILSGDGEALAQIGRTEEARKNLSEALNLARELKNDALVAQTLGYQGDDLYYRGDLKSAKSLYEQAAKIAVRTGDRNLVLVSKVNLVKMAIAEGHSQTVVNSLHGLAGEADTLGLAYLSVECSVYLAEALVSKKDYTRAIQELERTLGRSEKLGLRTLLARSHYLFARALQATGNAAEAARHYSQAHEILDEIQQEARTDAVLKRSDLSAIYAGSAAAPK